VLTALGRTGPKLSRAVAEGSCLTAYHQKNLVCACRMTLIEASWICWRRGEFGESWMQLVYVSRSESEVSSLVSCPKTELSGSWTLARGAGTNPSLCYIDSYR
jgi:hypothetical protein